jgi:hypothetical protein
MKHKMGCKGEKYYFLFVIHYRVPRIPETDTIKNSGIPTCFLICTTFRDKVL